MLFSPYPSATEVFKNFDYKLDNDNASTQVSIKSNVKTLYQAKFHPLRKFSKEVSAKDTFYSTQHNHLFTKFYSNNETTYCHSNLSTAIMNINFKFDGVYYLPLSNLNNVDITKDYGSFAGLKHLSGKRDLDEKKCVASFWTVGSYMNTLRAVSVGKNTSVPITPYDVSLSREIDFPYPFKKMSNEVIRNITMDKNTKRYNLNDKVSYFLSKQNTCSKGK